jgi:hypothetical protein
MQYRRPRCSNSTVHAGLRVGGAGSSVRSIGIRTGTMLLGAGFPEHEAGLGAAFIVHVGPQNATKRTWLRSHKRPWNQAKASESTPIWTEMAEGVGFEPTLGLPLGLISSQVQMARMPLFYRGSMLGGAACGAWAAVTVFFPVTFDISHVSSEIMAPDESW